MPKRPLPTLVQFGPCRLCGVKAQAVPTATAGHRCVKSAGRWIKLEAQPEGDTAA
jgi:hypothetical protein